MNNILKAIKDFLKSTYDLTKRVRVVNPCPNIDAHYGPYESLDDAKTTLSAVLKPDAIGRTIGVISNNKVIEYWWQPVVDTDGNLTTDDDGNVICDFVIKQCIDLNDVEVTRIPANDIDLLFDDNPNEPTIDTGYTQGTTGGTEGEVGGTEE